MEMFGRPVGEGPYRDVSNLCSSFQDRTDQMLLAWTGETKGPGWKTVTVEGLDVFPANKQSGW